MKFISWRSAASYCEDTYETYVDWDERFFICPECDEPLYESDWEDWNWVSCPICEFNFYDEDGEEEY